MFLPLWRTQAPLPAMLSSEILSGSGNPRWNHLPRHDCGNEHREEEPKMRNRQEMKWAYPRPVIRHCEG